jgi:tetratricopeptide (TPR) repeat protein
MMCFRRIEFEIRCILLSFVLAATCFADSKTAERSAGAGKEAMEQGRFEEAVELFSKAIEDDSNNPALYGNRANAYSSLRKLDEALKDYDTAIQKTIALSGDPKDKRLAFFLYNRGYAYYSAGRITEALVEYQKVIDLDPAYADAHGNIAWILATHPDAALRDPKKALEYALVEAKRTGMTNAEALDTLAAAHAANGQFDEARRYQKLAISKVEDEDDKAEYVSRLRLYEQGKAYIEMKKP